MTSGHSMTLVIAALMILTATNSPAVYCAPPTDPCSLLTADQVSTVLGVKSEEGKPVGSKLCGWTAPASKGSSVKRVIVTLETVQGFAYAKMPAGNGITKVPVSGLGDDAVFGVTPHLGTSLTVKKGDFVFAVTVGGFPFDQPKDADDVRAKEEKLARQILDKL